MYAFRSEISVADLVHCFLLKERVRDAYFETEGVFFFMRGVFFCLLGNCGICQGLMLY